MSTLFLHLVNISITASWLIAAVILLRVFLKKAPRAIVCVLWAIVGIRLILPFSIESAVSLIPSRETIPADIALSQHPVVNTGIPQLNAVVNPVIEDSFAPQSPAVSVNPLQIYISFFSIFWVTGMVILLLGAAVSYIRLRKQVSASLPLGEHIRVCDDIPAPFILGVFNPTIYIPSSLTPPHINYVLAHEKAHIRRGDFLWKPLGYLLLMVYWYNPLCWAAYILLCRDIEAACDEKVIRSMGREEKASYSQALLDCSFPRRMLTACPLAFGEVGVKSRVRAVLHYKKPAFWLIILSAFICLVIAVLFLTDPRTEPEQPEIPSFGTTMIFDHFHDNSGYEWGLTLHIEPADFPGTTFRCVSYEKLEMINGDNLVTLFHGMPINSLFFSDLNGDGVREVIAGISIGSGMIDDRIVVYDVANSSIFELEDRFIYDYEPLYLGEELVVEKRAYDSGEILGYGSLSLSSPAQGQTPELTLVPRYDIAATEQLPSQSEILSATLQKNYPEYFGLDASHGLTIYIWQMAADSYSCTLSESTGKMLSTEELAQAQPFRIDEMRMILSAYDLPAEKISVIPVHLPYSSYWYEIDADYEAAVRELFFPTETIEGIVPEVNSSVIRVAPAELYQMVFPRCLNVDTFIVSYIHHIPVYKMETKGDLDQFIDAFDDILRLHENCDGWEPSFAEAAFRYDDAFFRDHTLTAAYVGARSGSFRYDLQSILCDGEGFVMLVEKTNHPENYTDDMAGWLILAEVPDAMISGCTSFDAQLIN